MDISLRSQLVAGVAVAGAAAIAITPIVNPQVIPSLERVSASVDLVAVPVPWSNPITELIATLGLAGENLLGTGVMSGPPGQFLPVPFPEDVTGFGLGQVGWLPQLLNPISVGFPNNQANQLAENGFAGLVVSGTPLLQAVGTNLSGYGIAGLQALSGLGTGLGAVAFGVPLALVDIVTALVAGDPVDIQQIIETTIIEPVTAAFTQVVDSATFVVENLLNNVLATVTALPSLAVGLFGQAFESVSFIANQVLTTITDAFGAGSLQGIWNTLVDGFVGPDGVLGSVVKLSVGFGVAVGEDPMNPDAILPSLRQVISGGTIALGQAITNDPLPAPLMGAAVSAAASVAPVQDVAPAGETAPAEVPTVEVPTVEVPTVEVSEVEVSDVKADVADTPAPVVNDTPAPAADSDSGAGSATDADDAPAPKAKQRVSRKAS